MGVTFVVGVGGGGVGGVPLGLSVANNPKFSARELLLCTLF